MWAFLRPCGLLDILSRVFLTLSDIDLDPLISACTGKRPELEDEDADDGWAVEKSLTKHQARTYILSKQNKYRCGVVSELGVILISLSFFCPAYTAL